MYRVTVKCKLLAGKLRRHFLINQLNLVVFLSPIIFYIKIEDFKEIIILDFYCGGKLNVP